MFHALIVDAHVPDALACRQFTLIDATATDAFGHTLARALADSASATHPGAHVQLSGDLGAGKTALVRAVLRGLGHAGRVRSPTYTLCEPYNTTIPIGPLPVYHFDLYRFAEPAEWHDAGFREHFSGRALCLVEWPEKAGLLLGTPDLLLRLEPQGTGRRLTMAAFTSRGLACLERC